MANAKPDTVVEQLVRECITNDEYVDGVDIENVLRSHYRIILTNRYASPRLQEIQVKNRFVHSCIQSYKHTHFVQLYNELESFIVSSYNAYAKRNFVSFDDVNLGCLARHPDVKKMFGFSDKIDPSRIIGAPLERVMDIALEFFKTNRAFRGADKSKDAELQASFEGHLRQRLLRSEPAGSAIGVSLDYAKDIFHKFIKLRCNPDHIIEERVESYKQELTHSLERAFMAMTSKTRREFPNVKESISNWRDLGDIVNKTKKFVVKSLKIKNISRISFDEFAFEMCKHFNISTEDADSSACSRLIGSGKLETLLSRGSNLRVNYSESRFCELMCSDLIWVAIALGRLRATDANETMHITQFDEIYNERLIHEVPPQAMKALKDMLPNMFRDKPDYKEVKSEFEINFNLKQIFANWKSNCNLLCQKSIYIIGTITSIFLMIRYYQYEDTATIDQNPVCDPTIPLNLNNMLGDVFAVIQSRIHNDVDSNSSRVSLACNTFITSLSKLESVVLDENGIDSFDRLKLDTFIKFILSACNEQLAGIICEIERNIDLKFGVQSMQNVSSTTAAISNAAVPTECFDANYLEESIEEILNELMPTVSSSLDVIFTLQELEVEVLKHLDQTSFFDISGGKSFIQFVFDGLKEGKFELLKSTVAMSRQQSPASSLLGQLVSIHLPASYRLIEMIIVALLNQNDLNRWDSKDELQQQIAELIASYFGLTLPNAEILTSTITPRLSENGIITAEDSGIKLSLMYNTDIKCLEMCSTSTDLIAEREKALALISSAPFGASCYDFCQWSHFERAFIKNNEQDTESDKCSIIDFIAIHSKELANPERFYMITSPNDCIALPMLSPAEFDVHDAMECDDNAMVACWMLASKQPNNNRQNEVEFATFLRNEFLIIYSSAGVSGLKKLIERALDIVISVSSHVQHLLLIDVGDIMGDALGKISLESIFSTEDFRCLFYQSKYSFDLYRIAQNYGHLPKLAGISELIPAFNATSARSYLRDKLTSKATQTGSTQSSAAIDGEFVQSDGSKANGASMSSDLDAAVQSESADVEFEASNDTCRAFVDKIIAKRFKDQDTEAAIMLKNSLLRLSSELYSSDVHFVSELVQNADDNDYADEVNPSLRMVLTPQLLEIYNNEKGFSPENVDSIANISESTKACKTGYIGKKGIGFKSVFSISSAPEIHSKGFHIKFEKDFMVKPIWLEDSRIWPAKSYGNEYYETCIRLNHAANSTPERLKLTAKLKEVCDERLILFLTKLRSLIFEDIIQNRYVKYSQRVLSKSWRISETESGQLPRVEGAAVCTKSHWFVVSDTFTPTALRPDLRERHQTSVVIALKFRESSMDSSSSASSSSSVLTLDDDDQFQPIYAFLPTKCAWFKFVVQCDFVLVSSRERIAEGSEWNEQLMKKIPDVFVSMMQALAPCLKKPNVPTRISLDDEVQLSMDVKDFIGIIPAEPIRSDKVQSTIVVDIYSKLQGVPWLLSVSDELCKPSDLIYVSDLFEVTRFIPEQLLHSVTGKRYLRRDFVFSEKLQRNLNIRKFDIQVIVDCISSMATSAASSQEKNRLLVGLLLAAAHVYDPKQFEREPLASLVSKPTLSKSSQHYMVPSQITLRPSAATTNYSREIANKIFHLSIWPIFGSEELCSLEKHILWLSDKKLPELQQRCVDILPNKLKYLDEHVFSIANEFASNGSSILRKFLIASFKHNGSVTSQFGGGIEELNEQNFCSHVICKTLSGKSGDSIDRITASAYLAFTATMDTKKQEAAFSKIGLDTHGIPVPALSCHVDNHRKIVWEKSTVIRVMPRCSIPPECEVHVGPDIRECATSQLLTVTTFSGVFGYLSWTIIDPLVAALISGSNDYVRGLLSKDSVPNDYIQHFSRSQSVIDNLLSFMYRIGVVNFFGYYQVENQKLTPHLFKMIDYIKTRSSAQNELEKQLAIFLPNSKTGIIGVTDIVFTQMKKVVDLIEVEVQRLFSSLRPNDFRSLKFLNDLNEMNWYPVQLQSNWFSQEHLPYQHVLASPENILPLDDPSQAFHFLAVNGNENAKYREWFSFSSGIQSRYECVEYFLWIVRQQRVRSNVAFMKLVYLNVFQFVRDSPSHFRAITVLDVIKSNVPFLWFPDKLKDSDGWGRVFPLSQVASTISPEVEGYFLMDNCPVRLLSMTYKDDKNVGDEEFSKLFCRQYDRHPTPAVGTCLACKAEEGRFGSRGMPLRQQTAGFEDSGRVIPCTCLDTGFGKFLPHLPGLVAPTPTLAHFCSLLRVLKEQILEASVEKADSLMTTYRSLLSTISRNVWNTLHISNSLHPYSADALSEMCEMFMKEELLPGKSQPFISASSKCMAVDNPVLLQNDVANSALEGFDCIDVTSERLSAENEVEEIDYDLTRLKEDQKSVLRLSIGEFGQLTKYISPKTFFAPAGMAALLRLLGIPFLSSLTTQEWSISECKPQHTAITVSMAKLINDLLLISQSFFTRATQGDSISDLTPYLRETAKTKFLLSLKIRECPQLRCNYLLQLDDKELSTEQEANYYLEKTTGTLYVSSSITTEILKKLCCDLIINTFRVDIATFHKNKCEALLSKFELILSSFVNLRTPMAPESFIDANRLPEREGDDWKLIEAAAIESVDQVDEAGDIPDTASDNVEEAVKAAEADVEIERQNRIKKSLDALQKQSLEEPRRFTPAKPAAVAGTTTPDASSTNLKTPKSAIAALAEKLLAEQSASVERVIDLPPVEELQEPLFVFGGGAKSKSGNKSSLPKSVLSCAVRVNAESDILQEQDNAAALSPDRMQSPHSMPAPSGPPAVPYDLAEVSKASESEPTNRSKPIDYNGIDLSLPLREAAVKPVSSEDMSQPHLRGLLRNSGRQPIAYAASEAVPLESYAAPAEAWSIASTIIQNEVGDQENILEILGKHVGRFGECLGLYYLRQQFGEVNLSIRWVNEHKEQGLPFDIEVVDLETNKVVSYVEVKTRRQTSRPIEQWFISLGELDAARAADKAGIVYACLLISLQTESQAANVLPIGLEHGLVEMLNFRNVSLILQATKGDV